MARPPRSLIIGLALAVIVIGAGVTWSVRAPRRQLAEQTASGPEHPPLRWVAGDMHLHTEATGKDSLSLEQIRAEMASQGLDVGAVLAWGVRFPATNSLKEDRSATATPPLIGIDLETSSFGGDSTDHVIALGLTDRVFPRRLSSYRINQWAFEQGAVVGAAHACHWPAEPNAYPVRGKTQVCAELPLNIACGQRLFLATELLDDPGFLRLWYGLLSCGFEVPLAGGSDWPVAGTHAGEVRTHVGVPAGERLTYDLWIRGIAAGRTVIARGKDDLVIPWIDAAGPGSSIEVSAPLADLPLRVEAKLAAASPVEVVVNGAVVAKETLAAGASEHTFHVAIPDSAWVAVRSPNTHSGAIYVRIDGRPIRASVEAACYFRAYVDVALEQIRGPGFCLMQGMAPSFGGDPALAHDRDEALETYRPCIRVFDRIIEESAKRAEGR